MRPGGTRDLGISVKFDPRQVERARVELAGISNGLNKALSGAINKVLTKGRTEAVNGLASVLNISKRNIRYSRWTDKKGEREERVYLIKSAPDKLEGFIRILARPLGLINYKFKEVRKKRKGRKYGTSYPGEGIFASVYKGKPFRLKHAFVAMGKQGIEHIFERRKAGGRYAARTPIKSVKGPSLLTVYREHPELHAQVEKRITEELGKELDSQIDRFLKRSKA